MTFVKLSYMIENDSPVHIGLKSPDISPNNQISNGNGYNTYMINVENHSGTHIDAPGHFIEGGKIISDYDPNELVFHNPVILDCPTNQEEQISIEDISNFNLKGKDCIVFHTGFGKYRKENIDTYLTLNPGIEPDLVYWIRKNYPEIRCIGIDCVSISSFKKPEEAKKAHINAFMKNKNLGEPLLLVEDIKIDNIKKLDAIKTLIVVPWNIKGIDSAPCIVLAKNK